MPINQRQIGLLLGKLSEAGCKSDQSKLDWLYDHGVNVNAFGQLEQLTNQRLNELLEDLRE